MEVYHATTLLIIALGAFFIPLFSERARVPAAVGEILFGIVIAGHGLDLIVQSEFTRFIGDFGFAFLMFLAGMEIDFANIEKLGRRWLTISILAAASVFVISLAAVAAAGLPLLYVLVLGSMSLGLALVALKDTGHGQSSVGQTVLVVGSMGEFVTIVLLTSVELASHHGVGVDLFVGLVKLGLVFGAAYAVLVVLRSLVWWFPHQFERLVRTHDTSEVGVRASFAVMISFIAVAALLGVETILGAFVAGALMSFVFREKAAVEHKLSAFGFGFFIPIFFIEVGMGFELAGVFSGRFIWLLLFFIIAGTVARSAPMFLFRLLGLGNREVAASGLILSAPLTLLVAISQVGLDGGLIDDQAATAIVLYAILGGMLFPVLFKHVASRIENGS